MPSRAAKICSQPGCPTLIFDGQARCEVHKRARWKEYERRRPPRDKAIYHSPEWLKVRGYVLGKEPLCRLCTEAGRAIAATEVDHIKPIKDGGAPFAPANLRPLCLSCHSRLTMQQNRERGLL